MPQNVKKPSPGVSRPSSFISLLSGWVQQGVESFLATERILVDLALRGNATVVNGLREGFTDPEHSPAAILKDLAIEGSANFIEAQRIVLDLAQKQSALATTGIQERVGDNLIGDMAGMLHRSIDTLVEMQQEYLTIVSKHTQGWLQGEKVCLMALARDAMENFINAQKEFLDAVSEKPKPAGKKTPADLQKLAREAADAFIDAQKKLLDLAGQEINVSVRTAGRVTEMVKPLRMPAITGTIGTGLKSFVTAQKAIFDATLKPAAATKAPAAKARPKRRAARTKPAAAAQAVGSA